MVGFTQSRAGTIVLTVVGVSVAAAQADTIFVDDDCRRPGDGSELDPYCSIQTAIDNALDTDEIVVAPGTYFETIDFLGKAIALRSSDGPDVTVIDAAGLNQTAVLCVSGEGPGTVLDGFLITAGRSGRGVRAIASSPTVTNCTFSGNSTLGMYHLFGSPTVTNCTFSENTGSGIMNDSVSVTVTNCTFSMNTAGFGGGIWNNGGSLTLANCTFEANTARSGGGMYSDGGTSTVTDCVFIANIASDSGGGIYSGNPTVTNCAFIANIAGDSGGGISNSYNPTLANCTFSGNSAASGNALAFDSSPSDLTMTNCILWDGGNEIWNNDGSVLRISYTNVQGGWPGTTNIDADPLFVDPDNGDFRLSPGSPCIDAGHNNAIADLTDTDLDGDPRFADDPNTTDTGCGVPVVVDMGAYEYQGVPAEVVFADLNADGFVGVADFMILIGCIGSSDPDCCIADLDLDGEVGMSDRLLAWASIAVEFSPVQ